jgi:hypothetical protein
MVDACHRRERTDPVNDDGGRLVEGETIALGLPDGGATTVTVGHVVRRHWSTVARGRSDGSPLFLKQFVDRRGRSLRSLYDDEIAGMAVGAEVFEGFRVPVITGTTSTRLIIGYEYVDFVSPDRLLRTDEARLSSVWPALCDALTNVIKACASAERPAGAATTKERSYATTPPTLQFKGIEIRSIGIPDRDGPFVVHDLGRPFVGPIEDLAATLLVSTAMLNWGQPLSRFLKGPPLGLAAPVADRLAPWLTPAAISAEVRREYRNRVRDRQAQNPLAAAARAAALSTIGWRYMREFDRWSSDHLANEADP